MSEPRESDLTAAPTVNGREGQGPPVVHRDGLAFVQGCDVPIWQLEKSRRAGSPPAAMPKVFPGLTGEGLEAATAYARKHSEEIDTLIRERGPEAVPPGDEGDDDPEEIRADLDEIFAEYGQVFRRLAQ